ncbi:hypothetical protein [Alkalihalobacillus sp. CinArs1]|uniref:hypothetical protein n=1 Tax=Alkalihalobacillus sp. CinArs1 TaxID=2995314 RepID=UPI0022DD0DCB|nr:hypothetical protein [Alkalihalobacillus sp. CinArs1]
MFVGQLLYCLGIVVTVGCAIMLLLSFFSGSGLMVAPSFGVLNGLIAMGVGDLVIHSNHRRNLSMDRE